MRSRRDQLQAYQFVRGRMVNALLAGDPNTTDAPLRRISRTTFAGVMVGALAMAGFGVYGLANPGGATAWRNADRVVIESGTGARYVWQGGQLHPMLNFASAKLFLGPSTASTATVDRASLVGVPRGGLLGIPGAPDSLPSAGDLRHGRWTVCAEPRGRGSATVSLLVGAGLPSGALGPDEGLTVAAAPGETYLVWRGQRLRVRRPQLLFPLGTDTTPQVVGSAWVDALPEGPDLTFPPVTGRGSPGPSLGGRATRVGQVLSVQNAAGPRFALVEQGGLTPVSPLVASLLLADPAAARSYPGGAVAPVPVTPDLVSSAPVGAALTGTDGYPAAPLLSADRDRGTRGVLCASTTGAGQATVFATAALPSSSSGGPAVPVGRDTGGAPVADQALVTPGAASLVQVVPQPGVTTGTRFLVTDRAVRFPVADADALKALGYADVAPLQLPPQMVDLLPVGPALTRAAAGRPVTG